MSTQGIPFLVVLACTFFAFTATSQNSLAYNDSGDFINSTDATRKVTAPSRFHKKLSGTYNGYAIEVATSDYPLDRSNPVFRQFGNIHYDKLDRGGYSYLILGRFSSDESALHFMNYIIVPKAKNAKLIHYKDGTRKVVRAE